VLGFEIVTAPFAVAQLQLYLLLDSLGAKPDPEKRLTIFLTNSLTGWRDSGDIISIASVMPSSRETRR
jgi:hypothetical protein